MSRRSSGEVLLTDLKSMWNIVVSPYEGGESAEVGERLFEYTQSLMDPNEGLSSTFGKLKGPSREAIELFGEEEAHNILRTNRFVSSSGMFYGVGWTEGRIASTRCDPIKKEFLLLCIRDHRIARADVAQMTFAVKDLDLWKTLFEALSKWKLAKKYSRFAKCKGVTSFRKNKSCLRCILFVARAFVCMKVLEWDFPAISMKTSLKRKIHACFRILENLLPDNAEKKKPKPPKQKQPVSKKGATAAKVPRPGSNSARSPGTKKSSKSNEPKKKKTTNASADGSLQGDKCTAPMTQIITCSTMVRRLDLLPQATSCAPTNSCHDNGSNLVAVSPNSAGKTRDLAVVQTTRAPNTKATTFSHVLFGSEQTTNGGIGSGLSAVNKNAQQLTHALFDSKNNASKCQNDTSQRCAAVEKKLPALRERIVSDCISTDARSFDQNGTHHNFWCPVDPNELILNAVQIEMAWLVEESMYCGRKSNTDWVFVMEHASPALQIELRRIPDVIGGNNDEEIFAKLMDDGSLAEKRFLFLRREIRRKLLKNVVRVCMQAIVPKLRKATHPLLKMRKLRRQQQQQQQQLQKQRQQRQRQVTEELGS